MNYEDGFEPEEQPDQETGQDLLEQERAKSKYERLIEFREFQQQNKGG